MIPIHEYERFQKELKVMEKYKNAFSTAKEVELRGYLGITIEVDDFLSNPNCYLSLNDCGDKESDKKALDTIKKYAKNIRVFGLYGDGHVECIYRKVYDEDYTCNCSTLIMDFDKADDYINLLKEIYDLKVCPDERDPWFSIEEISDKMIKKFKKTHKKKIKNARFWWD
jgi:hypothetical protein